MTDPDGVENCLLGVAADNVTGFVYVTTANQQLPSDGLHVWRSTQSWCTNPTGNGWVLANLGLPTMNQSASAAIAWTGMPNRLSVLAKDPMGSSFQQFVTADGGVGPTGWTHAAAADLPDISGERSLLWAGI